MQYSLRDNGPLGPLLYVNKAARLQLNPFRLFKQKSLHLVTNTKLKLLDNT